MTHSALTVTSPRQQLVFLLLASGTLLALSLAILWDTRMTLALWWSAPLATLTSATVSASVAVNLVLALGAAILGGWSVWNLTSLLVIEAALQAARAIPRWSNLVPNLTQVPWLTPTSRKFLKRRLTAGAIAATLTFGTTQTALADSDLEQLPPPQLGWANLTIPEHTLPTVSPTPAGDPTPDRAKVPTPDSTTSAPTTPVPTATPTTPAPEASDAANNSVPAPATPPATVTAPSPALPLASEAAPTNLGWTNLLTPAATSQAFSTPMNNSPTAAHSPSNSSKTYRVVPGDCLWTIASHHLGDTDHSTTARYVEAIYRANHEVIGTNPDMLFPGQTLELPTP